MLLSNICLLQKLEVYMFCVFNLALILQKIEVFINRNVLASLDFGHMLAFGKVNEPRLANKLWAFVNLTLRNQTAIDKFYF